MANNKGARALWITGPGNAEIREEHLPEPGEDEVLVRTIHSAISRGTESLVFRGEVPPSEYRRMRAPFQDGDFPGPVKYGYINVGVIEHGPQALLGRTVFCLFPHQTRYVVPATAVEPLPHGLPPRRAVLAANLQAALNGIWDAAPRAGDRIAVVGAGTLGCLAAWLASGYPGCEVELVELNPAKAAVAHALGVEFKSPRDATREADVVLHASGTSEGLTTALGLAGFEATVTELSWFGDRQVNVPLGEAFHSQRLRLESSQVASISAAQRARWTQQRQMQLVFRLLGDSRLEALITGESAFEALPGMLESLSGEPGDTLCHLINYTSEQSPA